MLPLAHCLFALALITQNPTPPREQPRTGPDQREVPAAPAPDPQVDAWTTQLVARLGDPNRAIARSAEAGLIALGPAAVPQLRKAAEGNVPEVAEHARRALEEIRLGPPPFRHRPGGPGGPPPGMRDGESGDRPWPPPFLHDGGDRRDGPQGGHDARDGHGPPPRDDGGRRDGNVRNDSGRSGPPRENDRRDDARGGAEDRRGGAPRDDARRGGPRDQAGRRDGERRDAPPPRWRRRDGPRGDGMRREGPPPPDRGSPPPRDDRHDDLHDAR
jgi:hypothetical protein